MMNASLPAHASPPRTTKVRLDGVSKHYGPVVALKGIDLDVYTGEFVTLLGPSGSGKTTLLNVIAGMAAPTAGRIWIDGQDATHLQPGKRGLGMVFQNYALMPHMTVFENVAFPLRVRKVPGTEIRRRVAEVLELVRLPNVANRKPAELSGGQQQRISVARCLVYNPAIILMDEPLGALDKKLREEMQLELKQLHSNLGITALYVTHDQEEALTMSDRIVLMNTGEIEQMGTPRDLYFHPTSLFSAEFLGDSNILDGKVVARGTSVTVRTEVCGCICAEVPAFAEVGNRVKVLIRPENLIMVSTNETTDLPNRLEARMVDTISFGGVVKSFLRLADNSTIVVQELVRHGRHSPERGSAVTVAWPAEGALVLPEKGKTPPS